jgi:GNAT superfamily N-acetyltransferase
VKQRFLDKVTVTEFRSIDRAFLMDTWARSYRVSEACEPIPNDAYFPWHRTRVDKILETALVLVARDRENPLFIYGYGVFERVGTKFVAHWVYTKGTFKRRGVASLLLSHGLDRLGDGATVLAATFRTYAEPKARELGFVFESLESLRGEVPA